MSRQSTFHDPPSRCSKETSTCSVGSGTCSLPQSRKDDDELADAAEQFEAATHLGVSADQGLSTLQFALLLLQPKNDAVTAVRSTSNAEQDNIEEPLAHWWTACSHKYLHCDSNRCTHTSHSHPIDRGLCLYSGPKLIYCW
eukprot:1330905-Prymnesium_polylepis.3